MVIVRGCLDSYDVFGLNESQFCIKHLTGKVIPFYVYAVQAEVSIQIFQKVRLDWIDVTGTGLGIFSSSMHPCPPLPLCVIQIQRYYPASVFSALRWLILYHRQTTNEIRATILLVTSLVQCQNNFLISSSILIQQQKEISLLINQKCHTQINIYSSLYL